MLLLLLLSLLLFLLLLLLLLLLLQLLLLLLLLLHAFLLLELAAVACPWCPCQLACLGWLSLAIGVGCCPGFPIFWRPRWYQFDGSALLFVAAAWAPATSLA